LHRRRGRQRLGFDFDCDAVFAGGGLSFAHGIGDIGDLGGQRVVQQVGPAADRLSLALLAHASLVSDAP